MDPVAGTLRAWLPAADGHASGERVTRLTGGEVELLVVDLADVSYTPPHTHDVEQVVVVLEGTVRMSLGDSERELAAGDAVIIPPHLVHGASSVGTGTTRLLEVRRVPNTTTGR